MPFGRPQEEGLAGELSRARRAISAQTKEAARQARNARQRVQATASKWDARLNGQLVSLGRRAGLPLSPEYVRGATHTTALLGLGALASVLLVRGAVRYRSAATLPRRLVGSGRGFSAWVTRVGDGDGMRVLHAPSLRAPGSMRRLLKPGGGARVSDTISVRLAGVDAPECAHFGQPGQAYGKEAKRWLGQYVLGERVRVVVHSLDLHSRALASVYKPRAFLPLRWLRLGQRNVSVELARAGYATVYEGANAQFGGARRQIESAIKSAQKQRVGMWAAKGAIETPAEFKRRMRSGAPLTPTSFVPNSPEAQSVEGSVNQVVGMLRSAYNFMKTLR